MPTNYDDLIDDYLHGQLDRETERQVQGQLETDEAFREAYQLRKRTRDAFLQLEHQRLKGRLQSVVKGDAETARLRPKWQLWVRWWPAAAVLVMLPAVAFLILPEGIKHNADELVDSYHTPYPNVVLPVLRSEQEADKRMMAYAAYEQGSYRDAYAMFDELRRGGVDDEELLFYQGISLFMLNDFERSAGLLSAYSRIPDAKLSRQAKWYLALAWIKHGDEPEAVPLLKELASTTGYMQTEAATLLSAL